jgi:hypothetical protein
MVAEARSRIADFLETQLFQQVLQRIRLIIPSSGAARSRKSGGPPPPRAIQGRVRRPLRGRGRGVPRYGALRGLDEQLAAFSLPTFAGVRDDMDKLAQVLGVTA